MAAAELNRHWQRATNPCFVQEDARRAPNSSCCSSSSSHDCGHEKNSSREQLDAFEAEFEVLSAGSVNKMVKFSGENQIIEEYCTQAYPKTHAGSCLYQQWEASPACMKNEQDNGVLEVKAVTSDNVQKTPITKDMGESWYADDHIMDLDPYNCLVFEQPKKLSSDFESHWIGLQKTKLWWHTADRDELASFVSHESLEHIENCDLPRPHTEQFGRGPSASPQSFDQYKLNSLNQMTEEAIFNMDDYKQVSPTSVNMTKTKWTLDTVGCSPRGSHRLFSKDDSNTTKVDKAETQHNNLSKAQLLEALCHSQTRAREAEKAAQQAYDEKEHINKLFFRQASLLFAYKQWLQLLQLETLYLQLKNNDQPISTSFPDFTPWVPRKVEQLRKVRRRAAKRKEGPAKCKICKYVVAFAVGLSFAGAGLLLGWTIGWLFPAR